MDHGVWLIHPELCWTLPAMPLSSHLNLFYIAKTGTHIEDLIFMLAKYAGILQEDNVVNESSDNKRDESNMNKTPNRARDAMMDIHHVVTAALCIVSYATGYVKIGSVVMLLHDISDIPLDALRVSMSLHWDIITIISYIALLLCWVYWRLWILSSVVLKSIIFDVKKSLLFPCPTDGPGDCFVAETIERSCFASLLGVLLLLHIVWFAQLVRKGYRMYTGGSKIIEVSNKKEE